MELNYENDFSLFLGIRIPGQLEFPGIIEWFQYHEESSYRLIIDSDYYENNIDFQTSKSLYEDVKMFGVVSNPWARVKLIYMGLMDLKTNNVNEEILNGFVLDSFESCVLNWPTVPVGSYWYAPSMPQLDWLQYKENGNLQQVDYIIRQENIEEDFKPFQNYFFNNKSYSIKNPQLYNKIYDYKNDYSSQMKFHIEKMFEKDIDTFKYVF